MRVIPGYGRLLFPFMKEKKLFYADMSYKAGSVEGSLPTRLPRRTTQSIAIKDEAGANDA